MEQQVEKIEKPKKERKPSVPKESIERGGSKRWVMIIFLVTVLLSLVFYLLSGNLSFEFRGDSMKVDLFSGMQEAKYSY